MAEIHIKSSYVLRENVLNKEVKMKIFLIKPTMIVINRRPVSREGINISKQGSINHYDIFLLYCTMFLQDLGDYVYSKFYFFSFSKWLFIIMNYVFTECLQIVTLTHYQIKENNNEKRYSILKISLYFSVDSFIEALESFLHLFYDC